MYTTEKYSSDISIDEYIDKYVNVAEFLEYCKACPNYGNVWSCPPYDFNPDDFWHRFSRLHLEAVKINFDPDTTADESMIIMAEVKEQMSIELYEMEKKHEDSVSLSAGSCSLCRETGCTRVSGERCRHPELMRYSIESIGGNVGLTVSKLLGIQLEWLKEGQVPGYFVLVGGLLIK